jgi:hypothetical protein
MPLLPLLGWPTMLYFDKETHLYDKRVEYNVFFT